jgi:2-dehydro-3-deoxyphosphogluconate aldolase/(4S)-4-hydroxy-2-oxoglutarate aldolase
MNKQPLDIISQQGFIPLFYHDETATCLRIAEALYKGGSRIIEFTNRGKCALENFKALKLEKEKSYPDLMLGIGTIKTAEQAQQFANEAPDFVVSPIISKAVADVMKQRNLPWIPGAFTPTEVQTAVEMDAKLIKIFPSNIGGPAYMQALKDAFKDVALMPTGGVSVDKENIHAWYKAGAYAVGLGSKLINTAIISDAQYKFITESTQNIIKWIGEIKNEMKHKGSL